MPEKDETVNETHGFWWDILKTISNVIALILAAAFGWLTRKFTQMDERMVAMEKDFTARNQQAATSIAVLQAYHQSNLQRLDSIDDKAKEINSKLDQLIVSMTNRRE